MAWSNSYPTVFLEGLKESVYTRTGTAVHRMNIPILGLSDRYESDVLASLSRP
jgi:hypothetical protein